MECTRPNAGAYQTYSATDDALGAGLGLGKIVSKRLALTGKGKVVKLQVTKPLRERGILDGEKLGTLNHLTVLVGVDVAHLLAVAALRQDLRHLSNDVQFRAADLPDRLQTGSLHVTLDRLGGELETLSDLAERRHLGALVVDLSHDSSLPFFTTRPELLETHTFETCANLEVQVRSGDPGDGSPCRSSGDSPAHPRRGTPCFRSASDRQRSCAARHPS